MSIYYDPNWYQYQTQTQQQIGGIQLPEILKKIYSSEYYKEFAERDAMQEIKKIAKAKAAKKGFIKPFEIVWDRVIDMRPHA